MKIYRFTLNIDDEIKAETLEDAWKILKKREQDGRYGPTIANLELIGEEEGETPTE